MSDFRDFGTFSTVFGQKEGQMLSDLNFEARVGNGILSFLVFVIYTV